ncbi:trypsin-like peptidase domain-containing protein [Luteipulveratus sp. YIM 133132]|uniref:S1C family serine protease n=1 Tax=Luteipulveratus flavus TaxID=3031728 RepID=UPI0023B1B6C3|nr:trypsin-like peptidase domain-containing protein [Luteipulveratus sp. YIM 133132]MDE9364227.1 trypsin-like peptidase domain-containing protein [Luteipulveratus sp. YIM 133132]
MRTRLAIAATSALLLTVAPATAVAIDRAMQDTTPTVSSAPASSAASGSGSSSSGSSGSATDWGYGPWSSGQTTATTSGTPVSSASGVVMVDTVLPGGEGAGSGIVLRSDGVVLTNYHVVEGSTSIRVTASGGKTYTASVVGYDESHDVAVLKLTDASGLATATFDTTTTVGEAVTAIGQGGGQGTLYKTSGTITASGQQITASDESSGSETLTGLLQTNAQIVAGYSGGPLTDADGEVVGMDTAASSRSPITGYAIPIASALSIATQIQNGTHTATNHIGARAALGVEVSSGTTSDGSAYGGWSPYGTGDGSYGSAAGAAVVGVLDGSGVASAGLAAGDTITAVGGHTISDASQLSSVMDAYQPGQRVSVQWSDASGSSHSATVTLGTSSAN